MRLSNSQHSTEDEVPGRIGRYPALDSFRRFRTTDIEVSEDRTAAIDRETEGLRGRTSGFSTITISRPYLVLLAVFSVIPLDPTRDSRT